MRLDLSDGRALRFEDHGAHRRGTAALLIHGFMGGVEAWGSLPHELARDRRVIALDLPGHGASDVPPSEGGQSLDAVLDTLDEVLDRLRIGRPHWIGYSMGGRIALAAAVTRPERVERLVLESASPGLAGAEARSQRRADDEARAAHLEREGLPTFVDAWLAQPLFATQRLLPAEVRRRERERRLGSSPVGLARTLRELGTGCQPSFWGALGQVEAPVLVLTGGRDEKFGAIGDDMVTRLRRGRRAVVADAGHAVHLEAPEAWLRSVRHFLGEESAPGAPG